MKKLTSCILAILLCLMVSLPSIAHADVHRTAQKAATKSWKKNEKNQKKSERSQKKAAKRWRDQHQAFQ